MKKVLLIGEDESNSFLLGKLQSEGCEVRLLTRFSTGSTMYERVATAQDGLNWEPDFVICDSKGYSPFLRKFREAGVGVVGGGPITDSLETNVATALQYLEGAEVPTIDFQTFRDVETAIDYVLRTDKPWRLILSPEESHGFPNGNALATNLQHRADTGTLPQQIVVHRDFPGIEGPGRGALSMWSTFHITGFVHEKGLMNPCFAVSVAQGMAEGGVPTIEGVTMQPVSFDNPLVQLTLGRVASSLGRLNYTGLVTLGCLIQPPDYTASMHWDEEGGLSKDTYWDDRICVNRISFTPPPGFWAAFCAGLEMPMHLFLDRLTTPPRNGNPFDFWQGVVSSRKLTLPPYPLTEAPWLTTDQRLDALKLMPPIRIPYKPQVLWNGVAPEGETAIPVCPVLGYLTGKAGDAYQSLTQIRSEFEHIQIPYAQVSDRICSTFELDMLPAGIAQRQLDWEREVKTVYKSATKPNGKRVKVVAANV